MTNSAAKKLAKEEQKTSTWWGIKKTEADWQNAIDSFFLNFTPKWFTFLGWLLTLGVLKYFYQKTNSRGVSLLYGVSFITLLFFLQSTFFRFPFYKFLPSKFVSSERFAFGFSIIVAGILLFFLQVYLLDHLIKYLSTK